MRHDLDAEVRAELAAWVLWPALCLALLAWALWPSSAAAQVASVCGPGKACSARTFTATGGNASTAAGSFPSLAVTGTVSTPTTYAAYIYGSATTTASLAVQRATSTALRVVQDGVGATSLLDVSGYLWMRHGYDAALAFASFPACAAGTNGRLLFDSTNNRWRYCVSGTGWLVLAHEWAFAGYLPDPGAPTALSTIAETRPSAPGVVTNLHAQLINWFSPTSASGNYVITVYDATAGTTLCTLTKTCASGTGSTTCSGAVVAGNRLIIKADSSGCGAGTVGAFNVTAQITGG